MTPLALDRMRAARGLAGSSVTAKQPRAAMDDILPNADAAVIDPRKVTGYSLNADHPVGGSKARVFASALGFTQANASDLMEQIKAGIRNGRQLQSVSTNTAAGSQWTFQSLDPKESELFVPAE